jgi:hypothetical protein
MKPVYSTLRQKGHVNTGYIDDSLLLGSTFSLCQHNIDDTVSLMSYLGFIIHDKKSVLVPTQKIRFLGFDIDSENMLVTLPAEKVAEIVSECLYIWSRESVPIRKVARVLGLLVASFSAVEYGPLHYRHIEWQKIEQLKINFGNFDAFMQISLSMKSELLWWICNLHSQKRHITHDSPSVFITTDASSHGYGAVKDNLSIGGRWTEKEADNHINYLETLAIYYALKAFCKDMRNVHIRIQTDNTCAMSYINAMGGIKSMLCNDLAKQIWLWCIDRSIWLSASYISGRTNVADICSRKFNENVEWMLDRTIFLKLIDRWGTPTIDLFASRLNKQIDKFVSWYPDPEAKYVNAFSLNWSSEYSYIFPPFSLIMRCLQKIRLDKATCLIVCPRWTTQNWWTPLMNLLIDFPVILPRKKKLLILPGTDKTHVLSDKIVLIACKLSGVLSLQENFHQKLLTLSYPHGDIEHKNSITQQSKSGFSSVMRGKLVPFVLL